MSAARDPLLALIEAAFAVRAASDRNLEAAAEHLSYHVCLARDAGYPARLEAMLEAIEVLAGVAKMLENIGSDPHAISRAVIRGLGCTARAALAKLGRE